MCIAYMMWRQGMSFEAGGLGDSHDRLADVPPPSKGPGAWVPGPKFLYLAESTPSAQDSAPAEPPHRRNLSVQVIRSRAQAAHDKIRQTRPVCAPAEFRPRPALRQHAPSDGSRERAANEMHALTSEFHESRALAATTAYVHETCNLHLQSTLTGERCCRHWH